MNFHRAINWIQKHPSSNRRQILFTEQVLIHLCISKVELKQNVSCSYNFLFNIQTWQLLWICSVTVVPKPSENLRTAPGAWRGRVRAVMIVMIMLPLRTKGFSPLSSRPSGGQCCRVPMLPHWCKQWKMATSSFATKNCVFHYLQQFGGMRNPSDPPEVRWCHRWVTDKQTNKQTFCPWQLC